MQNNYFDIARTVLTQPETAARILETTEQMLGADPFNPSLVFANGMAALQLRQITGNTLQGIEFIRNSPPWIPAEMVAELLPQLDYILAQQDAKTMDSLKGPGLVDFEVNTFDHGKPLNAYTGTEIANLASSDIEEYARYRKVFDENCTHPVFSKLPANLAGDTLIRDLKTERSKVPSSQPLVIFFQGFFSDYSPGSLRIPSFQIPFSQQELCRRIDPEHQRFSRIFVRDYFQIWYQAGLHGRGSVQTLMQQLAAIIKSIRPSQVITFGVSAGGFASLLFGYLLGARKCIAFSPQTEIFSDTPGGYFSDFRKQFHGRFLMNRPYVYSDIAKIAKPQTRVKLFYSTHCEGDKYHAQRLFLKPNIEFLGKLSDVHGGYLGKELAENTLLDALT